jgi:hypothetical protein
MTNSYQRYLDAGDWDAQSDEDFEEYGEATSVSEYEPKEGWDVALAAEEAARVKFEEQERNS